MGLITEILCKHTYQGNHIPYNIVFLASCLPYKLIKKELKEKAKNKTVYVLNHLPNTLWNFIFNFGNLNEKDEKKLIINDIRKSSIINYFGSCTREIINLISEMIINCPKFLKQNLYLNCIPLNAIYNNYVNKLIEFSFDYLKNKEKKKYFNHLENKKYDQEETEFENKNNNFEIIHYSVILTVFIYIYLNLSDKKQKEIFNITFGAELEKYCVEFGNYFEIPIKEGQLIYQNKTLENSNNNIKVFLSDIFILFVCINTKTPIILKGKAEVCQSLIVQLVNQSIRRDIEKNSLFITFPRIIITSLKCSKDTTYEEVKSVFKKAKKIIKTAKQNYIYIISLVLFQEINLLENSPIRPLEAINEELEINQNKKEVNEKIAFIGMSREDFVQTKINKCFIFPIDD